MSHTKLCNNPPCVSLSQRLLEDIASNRARAEQIVSKYPEGAAIGIGPFMGAHMPGEGPLTQGGHLISEMSMLETAATEQRDSLRCVDLAHKQGYRILSKYGILC